MRSDHHSSGPGGGHQQSSEVPGILGPRLCWQELPATTMGAKGTSQLTICLKLRYTTPANPAETPRPCASIRLCLALDHFLLYLELRQNRGGKW